MLSARQLFNTVIIFLIASTFSSCISVCLEMQDQCVILWKNAYFLSPEAHESLPSDECSPLWFTQWEDPRFPCHRCLSKGHSLLAWNPCHGAVHCSVVKWIIQTINSAGWQNQLKFSVYTGLVYLGVTLLEWGFPCTFILINSSHWTSVREMGGQRAVMR